jgi:putative DNA primase/helicase
MTATLETVHVHLAASAHVSAQQWRSSRIRIIPALGLPEAMRARDQWVVWRSEQRDGKPTKVPYRPDGHGRAESTNPSTWTSLEQACAALKRDSSMIGVGFVFAADHAIMGIDLDKCRANGTLNERAASILEALPPTYTEVSPSKTGVKLFYALELPEPYPYGGRKKADVEVYTNMRYFTVTGWKLECAPKELTVIRDLDLITRALPFPLERPKPKKTKMPTGVMPTTTSSDHEVMARIARSRIAARVLGLYSGANLDFEVNGNEGASEADLALANYLWFFTGGDRHAVDRLFRVSTRMRPKWDERHSGDGRTYGEMTLDLAAANPDVWKPKQPRDQNNTTAPSS